MKIQWRLSVLGWAWLALVVWVFVVACLVAGCSTTRTVNDATEQDWRDIAKEISRHEND